MVANAITKPGTVVVHFWDTNAANTTVMRPLGLPVAASYTVVFVFLVRHYLRYYFGPSN